MTEQREAGEAGFTLVEVLVAFAIGSLALIMAFQIFGESAMRLGASNRAAYRVEEAAALVAALAAEPLQPGSRSGRLGDGTPYQIAISDAGGALGQGGAGLLYRVSVYQGPRPGRLILRTVMPGGSGG